MAATSSSPPCSSSLSLSLSAKKVGQQRFPALRRFLFFFFLSFQPTPGLCRATSVRGKSVCVYCIYNRHTHMGSKVTTACTFFLGFFSVQKLGPLSTFAEQPGQDTQTETLLEIRLLAAAAPGRDFQN